AEAAPVSLSGGHRAAIVLFSNDLDKAMAALIIACGMAASGAKVGIFFTFWGLSVLRRNPAPAVPKGFLSRMFGWMLPKGAAKLALSKMNMAGIGTAMMKDVMKRQNVTSLPELLEQARQLGVRFVACEMAMNVMGITREELVEVDEVAGVASFVGMAKESNNTLFI
ncbi:MAG TPA: pyridine nucleotide-disulfide oxidoreductase, partial [Lentisphaeria bacterium]|nr:pyridine nucleotide-disulfide oxidoreductase [Lentisphaeria bacterium]